jgi:hypothetical protein
MDCWARRDAAAGTALRLIRGGVTQLDDLGVGDGHTLLLESGAFTLCRPTGEPRT